MKNFSLAALLLTTACATVQPNGVVEHNSFTQNTYYSIQTSCLPWVPDLGEYRNLANEQCANLDMIPEDFSVVDYKLCHVDNKTGQIKYNYTLQFRCVSP